MFFTLEFKKILWINRCAKVNARRGLDIEVVVKKPVATTGINRGVVEVSLLQATAFESLP